MEEFRFEQDLVRALLREQHPDLADLELEDVAGGWDNQQWRLGAELAVRLPRPADRRCPNSADAPVASALAAPVANTRVTAMAAPIGTKTGLLPSQPVLARA